MTQNNAHVEAWASRGSAVGTLASLALRLDPSTNKVTNLNSGTAITDTGGGAINALHAADRTGSSTIATYENGVVQTAAGSSTSTALASSHVTLCKTAAGNCPASTMKMYFVGFGGAMNNEATHYANVRLLLSSIGVPGI